MGTQICRVTQAVLVIFPVKNSLSMNDHSSLKSICLENVKQMKLYKNDAVTW